jgi:hypothetical protein
MLIAGIILLVLGIVLLAAPFPARGEDHGLLRFFGWALILVGGILLIVYGVTALDLAADTD